MFLCCRIVLLGLTDTTQEQSIDKNNSNNHNKNRFWDEADEEQFYLPAHRVGECAAVHPKNRNILKCTIWGISLQSIFMIVIKSFSIHLDSWKDFRDADGIRLSCMSSFSLQITVIHWTYQQPIVCHLSLETLFIRPLSHSLFFSPAIECVAMKNSNLFYGISSSIHLFIHGISNNLMSLWYDTSPETTNVYCVYVAQCFV